MHWIKLTYANNGETVWVNLEQCGIIMPDKRKGCHIFTKRTGPVHVAQTVDQVITARSKNDGN